MPITMVWQHKKSLIQANGPTCHIPFDPPFIRDQVEAKVATNSNECAYPPAMHNTLLSQLNWADANHNGLAAQKKSNPSQWTHLPHTIRSTVHQRSSRS